MRKTGFECGQVLFLTHSGDVDERGVRVVIEAIQDQRLTVVSVDGEELDASFAEDSTVWANFLSPRGMFVVEMLVSRSGKTTAALDVPDNLHEAQQRQHVRVRADIPISCLLLDDEANEFSQFVARMIDISGGGMAIAGDVIAPDRSRVVCSIALPNEAPAIAIGLVLGSDLPTKEGHTAHTLRVRFDVISEGERDRVIRWVFANLRKLAQEGLA